MDVSEMAGGAGVVAGTGTKASQLEETRRLPLVPSQNASVAAGNRKPRTRDVASRYKHGNPSTGANVEDKCRRFLSPSGCQVSPTPGASVPARSKSADRPRPSSSASRYSASSSPASSRPSTSSSPSSRSSTPVRETATEAKNTTRRLFSGRSTDALWPSMRLNASPDQKPTPSANAGSSSNRKKSPLRGRNKAEQSENSRPAENSKERLIDRRRSPAGVMGATFAISMSKSVDFSDRVSRTTSIPGRGASPRRMTAHESLAGGKNSQRVATRGVSPMGTDLLHVRSMSLDSSSVSLPSRTRSSPIPGLNRPSSPNNTVHMPISSAQRPSSPNKVFSMLPYTIRHANSTSQSRPSTSNSARTDETCRPGLSSSVLNYIGDIRRGKKDANHLENVHQLRLLQNRHLQWRFTNAQTTALSSIQKLIAEDSLYAVWNAISELRDGVVFKKINLQLIMQELKWKTILKEQMAYLNDWVAVERQQSNSLSGIIEALKASTLRLPVSGGARADARDMRNAITSAVDVMQTMGSSICHMLSKVEDTKALASELFVVAANERSMLDECRELLVAAATLQIQEASLRAHLIQRR